MIENSERYGYIYREIRFKYFSCSVLQNFYSPFPNNHRFSASTKRQSDRSAIKIVFLFFFRILLKTRIKSFFENLPFGSLSRSKAVSIRVYRRDTCVQRESIGYTKDFLERRRFDAELKFFQLTPLRFEISSSSPR